MTLHYRFLAIGAAASLVVMGQPGAAEDLRGQGVAQRTYPQYEPQGVRVGTFVLRPSLAVSETYDSNIFARETNKVDDAVTTINPHVRLESDWANHALSVDADLEQILHVNETGEDRTNWSISAAGRVDVLRDTSVSVGLLYGSFTEGRGAPDAVGTAAEPTPYEDITATAGVEQRFGRLSAELSGSYQKLDFDDVPLIGGGIDENDDRDRTVIETAVQVGYQVVADTVVFLRGTYNWRDHDVEPPVATVDRDSDGYEVVAGVNFELGSLATGEIYAGYQEQDFESPAFGDVSGAAYGANIDWYVTPLTTVRFGAAKSLQDTTTVGASSFDQQQFSVGVDHEFLRNLIASVDVAYAMEDYEGTSREDDVLEIDFGIDYAFNRNFSAGFFYGYEERDSSVTGLSYSRDIVGVRMRSEL